MHSPETLPITEKKELFSRVGARLQRSILSVKNKIWSILDFSPKKRKALRTTVHNEAKQSMQELLDTKTSPESPHSAEQYSPVHFLKGTSVLEGCTKWIENRKHTLVKEIQKLPSPLESHTPLTLTFGAEKYRVLFTSHRQTDKESLTKGQLLLRYTYGKDKEFGFAALPFTLLVDKKFGKEYLLPGKKLSFHESSHTN